MTTLLGIDPGSRVTGFGVIQVCGSSYRYIASGCLRIKGNDLSDRLRQVFEGIRDVVEQYSPQQVAIEQVFMHQNPNAALVLGQARGVAIAATALSALPLAEYAPRQIKQAIVGYGNAEKQQMQHMIQRLLSLTSKPPTDAADALAVAVCHATTQNYRKRIALAEAS